MWRFLIDLPAEAGALGQPGLATSRLAENSAARAAENDRLGVAEHRGDVEAARALHVHKEAVRALHQALQLVLTLFGVLRREKEIGLDLAHFVCLTNHQNNQKIELVLSSRGRGSGVDA